MRIALFLIVLLMSHSLFAMDVRKDFALLAWNPAGSSALLSASLSGPEGGGAESYIIIDFIKQQTQVFTFSNDFSPGDGSSPQQISADSCKKTINEANQALLKFGFNRTLPDSCDKNRSGIHGLDDQVAPLENTEAIKVAKGMNLPGANEPGIERLIADSRLYISGRNDIHFIVIENNLSYTAKCTQYIYDADTKHYKKIGACGAE
jgi:hypothetical protein